MTIDPYESLLFILGGDDKYASHGGILPKKTFERNKVKFQASLKIQKQYKIELRKIKMVILLGFVQV